MHINLIKYYLLDNFYKSNLYNKKSNIFSNKSIKNHSAKLKKILLNFETFININKFKFNNYEFKINFIIYLGLNFLSWVHIF